MPSDLNAHGPLQDPVLRVQSEPTAQSVLHPRRDRGGGGPGSGRAGKELPCRRSLHDADRIVPLGRRGDGVGHEAVVHVQIKPFCTADNNIGIDVVNVAVFDDMNILNPCQVATAKHSTCIVRLIDIFKHNGDMTGTVSKHVFKPSFALYRNEVI